MRRDCRVPEVKNACENVTGPAGKIGRKAMRGYKSLYSAILTTFLLASLRGGLARVPFQSLLARPEGTHTPYLHIPILLIPRPRSAFTQRWDRTTPGHGSGRGDHTKTASRLLGHHVQSPHEYRQRVHGLRHGSLLWPVCLQVAPDPQPERVESELLKIGVPVAGPLVADRPLPRQHRLPDLLEELLEERLEFPPGARL